MAVIATELEGAAARVSVATTDAGGTVTAMFEVSETLGVADTVAANVAGAAAGMVKTATSEVDGGAGVLVRLELCGQVMDAHRPRGSRPHPIDPERTAAVQQLAAVVEPDLAPR